MFLLKAFKTLFQLLFCISSSYLCPCWGVGCWELVSLPAASASCWISLVSLFRRAQETYSVSHLIRSSLMDPTKHFMRENHLHICFDQSAIFCYVRLIKVSSNVRFNPQQCVQCFVNGSFCALVSNNCSQRTMVTIAFRFRCNSS